MRFTATNAYLEFTSAMDRLVPQDSKALAIAVSGGADSMAALYMVERWARNRVIELHVVTVDHGLRSKAYEEAEFVGRQCEKLGLQHRILTGTAGTITSDIQANARRLRLQLLGKYCNEHSVGHLLYAHTLDDQAETLLMRLQRGSGVDGLSAMRCTSEVQGLKIIRPLLSIRRSELRDMLKSMQLEWIEDPSNEDERYLRVRTRKVLSLLEQMQIDPGKLAATARNMQRASDALKWSAEELTRKILTDDGFGGVLLDSSALKTAKEELSLRVLRSLIMRMNGDIYGHRLSHLNRLREWLATSPKSGGRVLAGCMFRPAKKEHVKWDIIVHREPSAIAKPARIEPASGFLWDHRFLVEASSAAPEGLDVAALGPEGDAALKDARSQGQHLDKGWCNLPAFVRRTTPAFWHQGQIYSVPLAGFQVRSEISMRSKTLAVDNRQYP